MFAVMEMWSIAGLQLLLCLLVVHSAVVGSGIKVQLEGNNYTNHSVVPLWRITEDEPLTCTAICSECRLETANPKWFYPDGTEVTETTSNSWYTTRAVTTNQIVTLNLYRRGPSSPDHFRPQGKGSGLYRCRIQTSGRDSVQNVYVGLYRGTARPNEGKPNVISVQFHLDSASTDPFQFGPPVFTLTCHSTGGPATTVTWRRGNDLISEDANHVMTHKLVEQSGPVYNNTLTVSEWEEGWFSCSVSNTKGNSQERYRVKGTNPPQNLGAVQQDPTTVLVSWGIPLVGTAVPPSGYRIFYRPDGGQTITTPDTGPDVREYQLTDLIPGTTYSIAMVTVSEKLPSPPTDPVSITLDLGLTVLLKGQKYQDHQVVPMWQITESEPLVCKGTICRGCNLTTANPKWFYLDGTEVTGSTSNRLYTTSAVKSGQTVTLNLYRRGALDELSPQGGREVGLYRCRMQTDRAASSVQNVYVGLYRGDRYPGEGQPNVTSLEFHLDNVSTDPFQSGTPVFTLTCNSTGGPATTVTWKKDNTVLNADEYPNRTRTLVDQRGPVYSNTLTVSGRELGLFTCNVSSAKGNSTDEYRVQGATCPPNLTAVQEDATTVLVTWLRSNLGGLTPSGYRIFYRLEGGQIDIITTRDTGPNVTKYRLTDLTPGTTYMIAMVTLSEKLPSPATNPVSITLVPAPSTPTALTTKGVNTKGMTITWNDQLTVESYIVSFIGVTNCTERKHTGSHTPSCSTQKCTYNLTGLNEYSNYTITVTAVNEAGNASATISTTTLPAPPSGSPKNVRGTAGVSTITVQWDEVDCIDRNSEIVNYSLTYTSANESEAVLVPVDYMAYILRGLRPVTNYTVELAAVNAAGQVGPKATIDVMTLPGGQLQVQSDSHSSSDEGTITAAVVVPVCLVLTIAVAIGIVAAIFAKREYTRRVSSTTADMRKAESKAGHELYSISTTDCVAYGTATNRSGDCQEAREYEIPVVTPTSLPVSATACEQVDPVIYEPIPQQVEKDSGRRDLSYPEISATSATFLEPPFREGRSRRPYSGGSELSYTDWSGRGATFDDTPFGEGRSRRAYKGKYYGAGWSKAGDTCVVKEFKSSYAWAESDWDTEVKVLRKARQLAKAFSDATRTSRPIEYVWAILGKVSESDYGTPKLGEWVMVEDFIKGTWEKWNSNAGYVNPKTPTASLHAFSHWSYAKSGGKLLICDLQGVRYDDKYVLTDPVICSVDRLYGETDLGVNGMALFFSTHECSHFCNNLPLPPDSLNDDVQELKAIGIHRERHTSYSSESKFNTPVPQQRRMRRKLISVPGLEPIIEE